MCVRECVSACACTYMCLNPLLDHDCSWSSPLFPSSVNKDGDCRTQDTSFVRDTIAALRSNPEFLYIKLPMGWYRSRNMKELGQKWKDDGKDSTSLWCYPDESKWNTSVHCRRFNQERLIRSRLSLVRCVSLSQSNTDDWSTGALLSNASDLSAGVIAALSLWKQAPRLVPDWEFVDATSGRLTTRICTSRRRAESLTDRVVDHSVRTCFSVLKRFRTLIFRSRTSTGAVTIITEATK